MATSVTSIRHDEELLCAVETSTLVRPPVQGHLEGLPPAVAVAWLALAARWIDLSRTGGDLRYLNAACKLTGAAMLLHRQGAVVGVEDAETGGFFWVTRIRCGC